MSHGERLCTQRPSSQGNAIVASHFRSYYWNGKIGCSQGNGMIAYQLWLLFRRERNRSIDTFSICLFRWEQNATIPYHSTFHSTNLVFPFLEQNGSI